MKLHNRKPDIENLYKVLRRQVPNRPTLFEYFMNIPLYERLAGRNAPDAGDYLEMLKFMTDAFAAAGLDYVTMFNTLIDFPRTLEHRKATFSLNEGFCITDEESFERYTWPEIKEQEFNVLERIKNYLPEGMKILIRGPSGVFSNTLYLVGYDNLCYMIYEDPDLLRAIVEKIGERIVKYYETAGQYDTVGLMIINDDMAFKTQTLLSPDQLREFFFPWHKKIAEAGRRANIPVVIHCCGYFEDILDDIIDMGVVGKHSFEDAIMPVEEIYEKYAGRIAVLGGIDMDFILRSSNEEIYARSRAMLERTATRGGYALGTGNSVPEFVQGDKYLALIRAALEY